MFMVSWHHAEAFATYKLFVLLEIFDVQRPPILPTTAWLLLLSDV
jgi:hypothetical protein